MKRPRRTQAVVDNSPIPPAGVKVQYSNLPPVSRSRLEECLKEWATWHLQRFFPGYRPPETCSGTIGVDPELLRLVKSGAAAAWEDRPAAPPASPSATSKFNISYEQVGDVPAYDRASIAPLRSLPQRRLPGQPHYKSHPQQLYSLEASETATNVEKGGAGAGAGSGGGASAGSSSNGSAAAAMAPSAALAGPSAAPRCRNCGSYAHQLRECWRELKPQLQEEADREAAPGYRSAARRYFLVGALPSVASKAAVPNTPAPAGSCPAADATGSSRASGAGPRVVEDLGEDFVPLASGPGGREASAQHAELPPGFGQGKQPHQPQQPPWQQQQQQQQQEPPAGDGQAKKRKKNKKKNKKNSAQSGAPEELDEEQYDELPPGFAPYDRRSATSPVQLPPLYIVTPPPAAAPQRWEQPPAAWRGDGSGSGSGQGSQLPVQPPPEPYYSPYSPYYPWGAASEHPRSHQQPPWDKPYRGRTAHEYASSPQYSRTQPHVPTPQQPQCQRQPSSSHLPPGFGSQHSWRGPPSYY